MSSESSTTSAARWARPLALSVWLSAAVLVAFGGAITTLRAGMAIDGWWVLDRGAGDHFLLAYPISKWFRNSGTFAEHTHRLFGVLVGLLSIAYVIARTLERPRRRSLLVLAWVGLLAVCLQGAVGGFRVLENSPELAFLHGVLAQLVFALLGVNVVVSAREWGAEAPADVRPADSLRRAAWITALLVYAQIALGAWLRHTGVEVALTLHVVVAFLASGAVIALARSLRRRSDAAPALATLARRLLVLLAAQVGLGLLTLVAIFVISGGFHAEVSGAETVSATLHVLFGALLLQHTVAAALWAARVGSAPSRAMPSVERPQADALRWEAAR